MRVDQLDLKNMAPASTAILKAFRDYGLPEPKFEWSGERLLVYVLSLTGCQAGGSMPDANLVNEKEPALEAGVMERHVPA